MTISTTQPPSALQNINSNADFISERICRSVITRPKFLMKWPSYSVVLSFPYENKQVHRHYTAYTVYWFTKKRTRALGALPGTQLAFPQIVSNFPVTIFSCHFYDMWSINKYAICISHSNSIHLCPNSTDSLFFFLAIKILNLSSLINLLPPDNL